MPRKRRKVKISVRPTAFQITPSQVEKTCPACKNSFWIVQSMADRHVFCSSDCRKTHEVHVKTLQKAAEIEILADEAKSLGTLIVHSQVPKSNLSVLTPAYAAALRGKIANIISHQIDIAERVLTGEIKWSATQVQVFKALMNKVVPDISAKFHQHEVNNRDVTAMSRADLERMAIEEAEDTPITLTETPNADHQPPEGRPQDLPLPD